MKQQSAISSRLSSTNANASRRASIRVLLSLLAISTVLILSTAADNNSNTRYNNLGNRLLCPCESEPATGFGGKGGCHQVLLKCTHHDCTVSGPMRRELMAALEKGDTDDVILDSFVQEYGASVLVTPRMGDINRTIWIVASAVLAATAFIVIVFVRKWQLRSVMVTPPLSKLQGIDADALRDRVREETENDDG